MNSKRITESSNPVLAGSLPALRRAARRAKALAKQTGTRLVVADGGTRAKASGQARKRPQAKAHGRDART